jgi:FG-GAP-like repeat
MTSTLLSTILMGGLGIGSSDDFQPPTRLMADGVPVRVDSPGWACPCWADMDGDGKKDLLVGQFNGGKIRLYKNLGDGKLAAGDWLKADGAVAEIPGVW